ncbi:MAG: hypothetical protein CMO01_06560 [Thalassobius sp.]|nr:hypothetical protein [Thalassovita sp.]
MRQDFEILEGIAIGLVIIKIWLGYTFFREQRSNLNKPQMHPVIWAMGMFPQYHIFTGKHPAIRYLTMLVDFGWKGIMVFFIIYSFVFRFQ